MKTFTVASALLITAAAAQPHGHQHHHQHRHVEPRAVVTETKWVTEIEYVTELVDSTTTVWITPGKPTFTADPSQAGFFEHHSSPVVESVYTPQPTTPAYTPPPPPPTTYQAPTPTPQPTSVYTPPPPPPSPTHKPVAEAAPSAAPKPKVTAPKSGGSGEHSGEITYYDVGMGSCGIDDSGKDESEGIVAISVGLMGSVSNGNPMCGQSITIYANGRSTTAVVKDKCMGCAPEDIDVSKKVFMDLFDGLEGGRLHATWSFN